MDKEFLKTRSTQSSGALVKVLQSLQSMLGYQYHACWSLALQVLATLIEVLADSCPQPLTNVGIVRTVNLTNKCILAARPPEQRVSSELNHYIPLSMCYYHL